MIISTRCCPPEGGALLSALGVFFCCFSNWRGGLIAVSMHLATEIPGLRPSRRWTLRLRIPVKDEIKFHNQARIELADCLL